MYIPCLYKNAAIVCYTHFTLDWSEIDINEPLKICHGNQDLPWQPQSHNLRLDRIGQDILRSEYVAGRS